MPGIAIVTPPRNLSAYFRDMGVEPVAAMPEHEKVILAAFQAGVRLWIGTRSMFLRKRSHML